MEKLVHTGDQLPHDLVLSVLEIPNEQELYLRYAVKNLPIGWDALPSSTAAINIGDQFLLSTKYLGMIVPSAVMPEAFNVMLNPNHPAFSAVTITVVRTFEFDSRLLG